jgi:asparagine synthase (glutamine-hydrolysing)
MRYLALLWPPASPQAGGVCEEAVADVGRRLGWTPGVLGEGFLVLAPGPDACRIRPWGPHGVLIGEVYDAGDGSALRGPMGASADPDQAARDLVRRAFGRYVAIQTAPEAWAFRDPSGGVECLAWRNGDIQVVAGDLAAAPARLRPRHMGLNWDAIGRGLAGAAAAAAELPLAGLRDSPPGALLRLSDDGVPPKAIWRPEIFAAARRRETPSQLAEELTHRVDLAVGALVGSRARVVAEVSGGLDSAIVAGALQRLGLADRVVAWVNHHADRPEGDERAYARKVTERLGVRLTTAHLPVRPLTEADFTAVAQGPRLPFNALVPLRDADLASRLEAAGAQALVSGQGGDAIFFQMPTADILADELQARGLAGLGGADVPALARWLRRSCWSVMGEALRRAPAPSGESEIARVARLDAERIHPWVRDAMRLAPAKRRQILGLANIHVANGACRASARAELLYPLAAQPVIEFCLAVPAAVLTHGGRERALARAAFAESLPPEVRHRRKKGELTAFHAQTVAASLGFLRDYLLGGCLAEAGVLDRRRLERVLNADHLLWRAGAGDVLMAAATEAWVRHWQRYLPDADAVDRYGWAGRFSAGQARTRSSAP